jgi:hypothetical protein
LIHTIERPFVIRAVDLIGSCTLLASLALALIDACAAPWN